MKSHAGQSLLRMSTVFLLFALPPVHSSAEPRIGHQGATEAFGSPAVSQLIAAALGHDRQGIARAIARGADINAVGASGVTPLAWTELRGDTAAMSLLLERGANPDLFRSPDFGEMGLQPALWIAMDRGNRRALELLLQHKANPNLVFGNMTPLMFAVQHGRLDDADSLLEYGADINAKVGLSNALTAAVTLGDFKAGLWVLRHGFTRDLAYSRHFVTVVDPRFGVGQQEAKVEVIALIDDQIKALSQKPVAEAPH